MANQGNANNLSFQDAIDQLGGNVKKFHEFNFGKPERNYQESPYNPQSQSALDNLIQQYVSQQKNNQFDFAPIEQQARKDFSTKTLPTIANRYSDSRNSSGLNAANAAAGKDLETQLAQLRNQYGQQQFQNFSQLLGMNRQQNVHEPETGGLFGGLLRAVPAVAGAYFGGPAGAAAGGAIGNAIGGSEGGRTVSGQGALETPGGPTNQEQQAQWQQFMDFVNNYSNQNNQNASGGFNGGNPQGTNLSGESQIQQLVRMLGTKSGQFNNRNVVSNQRLGAY